MTMYDTIGVQAETSYRQRQITRQFRDANSKVHHQSRLRRWRETRHHHAA